MPRARRHPTGCGPPRRPAGCRAAAPGHRQPLARLDPQARRVLRPGHRGRGARRRPGRSAAGSRATSCTSASWRSTGGCAAVHGVLPAVLAAARPGAGHVVVPVENVGRGPARRRGHGARRRLPARRRRLVRRGRARHPAAAGAPAGAGRRAGPARARPRRRRRASRRRGSPSSWPPPAGTTCSCPGRRGSARPCSPSGWSPCCRHSAVSRPSRPTPSARSPGRSARSSSSTARHRSSRRTTGRRWRRSPVAGRAWCCPGRSRGPTTGCSSSTRRPSSRARCCRPCASRSSRGRSSIARARQVVRYPARFLLVLAANPCPCGRVVRQGPRLLVQADGDPVVRRPAVRSAARPGRPAGARAAGAPGGVRRRDRASPAPPSRPGSRPRREAQRAPVGRAAAGPPTGWCPGTCCGARRSRLPPRPPPSSSAALEQGRLTLRGYDRVLRVAWSAADLAGLEVPGRDEVATGLALRSGELVAA